VGLVVVGECWWLLLVDGSWMLKIAAGLQGSAAGGVSAGLFLGRFSFWHVSCLSEHGFAKGQSLLYGR